MRATNPTFPKSRVCVLIARAIQRELALMRRAEIDADLAQMGNDPEYRAEVLQMEAEFALLTWGYW